MLPSILCQPSSPIFIFPSQSLFYLPFNVFVQKPLISCVENCQMLLENQNILLPTKLPLSAVAVVSSKNSRRVVKHDTILLCLSLCWLPLIKLGFGHPSLTTSLEMAPKPFPRNRCPAHWLYFFPDCLISLFYFIFLNNSHLCQFPVLA